MNFFDIITRLFGIVPAAIDAAEQVANAVKTTRPINPDAADLWHTVDHQRFIRANMSGFTMYWCNVCQHYVYPTTQLCSEAVRRRNAGLS